MVNRWNIDNELMDITAAILNAEPVNPIHQDYLNSNISAQNKKRKYQVKRAGVFTECEQKDAVKMYCYSADIKETNHTNNQFKCELFMVVGIIRAENQIVDDFYTIKSKITQLFGHEGMGYMYSSLILNSNELIDVRLGDLGISGVSIQNTSNVVKDKCGVSKFEAMVKYVLYFSHS